MRHVDAGGDVVTEKQFFNGHGLRLCYLQQLHHVIVDHFQPPGELRIGGRGNGTAVEQPELSALGINETETGDAVTGVDS